MVRLFHTATAEQLIAAVEAVVVARQATSIEFVAAFADLSRDQAEGALRLGIDLGLLSEANSAFAPVSPLCRFFVTPKETQKAALLRLVLESYEPFVVFRERLNATESASSAAEQTKVVLDLEAHRETIKDTLLNLGTYTQALLTGGGGKYKSTEETFENALREIADGCSDKAAAEVVIRQQLGSAAETIASRDDVVIPLADALLKAKASDARGAVVLAGNAVESSLRAWALRQKVTITGATGINALIDKFDQAKALPKKLVYVGKFLGHIRNAADHGTDPEVGSSWSIRDSTGTEYVFVACSFIASCVARENSKPPEL